MPNQQEPTYERLYDMLDMVMVSHPDGPVTFREGLEVMMDYEIAEREPWKRKWITHFVLGCFFHFSQEV